MGNRWCIIDADGGDIHCAVPPIRMRRKIEHHLSTAGLSQKSSIAQHATCVLRCDRQAQPCALARHLACDANTAIDPASKGPSGRKPPIKIGPHLAQEQIVRQLQAAQIERHRHWPARIRWRFITARQFSITAQIQIARQEQAHRRASPLVDKCCCPIEPIANRQARQHNPVETFVIKFHSALKRQALRLKRQNSHLHGLAKNTLHPQLRRFRFRF